MNKKKVRKRERIKIGIVPVIEGTKKTKRRKIRKIKIKIKRKKKIKRIREGGIRKTRTRKQGKDSQDHHGKSHLNK